MECVVEEAETQIVTYKYRLLPTRQQHEDLLSILEQQRELYNAALEERISGYKKGVKIDIFSQSKALTILRNEDPEFSAVQRRIQRNTLNILDKAMIAFYSRVKKGKGTAYGFPKFKSKKDWSSFGFDSFCQIKFDGKRVRFVGMRGGLRVSMSREFPKDSTIKNCWFKRELRTSQYKSKKTGKMEQGMVWFIGFQIEVKLDKDRANPRLKKEIGVDWGTSYFAAFSSGELVENPKFGERHQDRIRRAARKLARAGMVPSGDKKGKKKAPDLDGMFSSSRRQTRARLQFEYRKVSGKRRNFLDKFSARLSNQFKVVAMEKLSVQDMVSRETDVPKFIQRRRNREALDTAPARARIMTEYKMKRAGGVFVDVDPANTTSPCHKCGNDVPKKLSEPQHHCEKCGTIVHRKVNSARNVLSRAGYGPWFKIASPRGKPESKAKAGPKGSRRYARKAKVQKE